MQLTEDMRRLSGEKVMAPAGRALHVVRAAAKGEDAGRGFLSGTRG